MWPTVVGLMATRDRPAMAHRAAHFFEAQRYTGAKRLLVFDDGVDHFIPCTQLDRVEVVYHEPTSLPAKRNEMMRYVNDPDAIYVVWDDDDYHGPDRIQHQVDALYEMPGATVCLYKPFLYYNQERGRIRRNTQQTPDASAAFRFTFWQERSWDETIDPGSGYRMIAKRHPEHVVYLDGGLDYIVVWHGNHRFMAPPEMDSSIWGEAPVDVAATEELLRLPSCL